MPQDVSPTVSPTDRERDLVVQCLMDAHEALRVVPGVDRNGPALVWLADQFLQLRRGERRG